MVKGQARIHRKFYEPSTERHDGLTLRCIENIEEIGRQIGNGLQSPTRSGKAFIAEKWYDVQFKALVDWNTLNIKTKLERPCSSGSFVIGWADIVAFCAVQSTEFKALDSLGNFASWEIDASYFGLRYGDGKKILGLPPPERLDFTIIIEVKPELKSASSIIRQLNQYRGLMLAERILRTGYLHKVIVTYDDNTKYDPLFENENITVIRYKEG